MAAVLYINHTLQQLLQDHLGSDRHHRVYETELVGLILAALLILQFDFLEDISIITDNQAAIKATTSFCSTPGQQLLDFFLNQMT